MDGVGRTGILDDKRCDWPMATLREPIISLTTAVILPLRSYRSITIIQLTSLVIGRSGSVGLCPKGDATRPIIELTTVAQP
ncbi:MAG: hypothetical protein F6J98_40370 [Moorea sp. SIO4G2]|nr:hypothetical protein [Moorena sp. SIO4A3]NEO66309.1 hypothetical protein [Moorena sp. SIO4G2]